MATDFPGAADNYTNPSNTDKLNNPSHSVQHQNHNDSVEAIEAKVGTGASTPTNNTFLIGNGTGTSAWSSLTSAQLAARLSDETGSGAAVFANTPTLVTPILGTPTSGVATNLTGLPLTSGVTGTLPVANGGTGVTSSTGTTNVVLSNSPTIVTPTIADFTNAQHDHADADDGGHSPPPLYLT